MTRRPMRFIQDLLPLLSGCLLLDRTRTDIGISRLHGSVGGAVRWCPDRRAAARSGAYLNSAATVLLTSIS